MKTTSRASKTVNASKVSRAARAKPAKIETTQTEPETMQTLPVVAEPLNLYTMLQNAMKVRAGKVPTPNQLSEITGSIKLLTERVCIAAQDKLTQTDFVQLCTRIENDDKSKHNDYVTTKSIEKIVNLLQAIAQGLRPSNKNLRVAVQTMLQNDKCANVAEMIAAQSVKFRDDENNPNVRSSVRSVLSCSKGTASSQTGQVRDVLRVMGLAAVSKGATNDNATLNEYGFSVLSKLYA